MLYLSVTYFLKDCHSLQIIPPGMEFHHIVPQDGDMDGEAEGNEDNPRSPDSPIWSEVIVIHYTFTFILHCSNFFTVWQSNPTEQQLW